MAYLPYVTINDGDDAVAAQPDAWQADLTSRGINADGYGLVGNGSADDTAALQAAIDAAGSGGKVLLPPGNFLVTSALTVTNDGVTIEGQSGWVSQIITTSRTIKALTIAADGFTMKGVRFDNQSVLAATAGGAVELTSGRSALISECVFSSGWWENVAVVNAYDAIVDRCKLVDAINAQVHYQSVSVPDRGDSWITNNLIGTSTGTTYGVLWESGGGLRIMGNKILEHDVGVMVYPPTGVVTANVFVQNNSIENQVSYGVRCLRQSGSPTVSFVHIQGNEIDCSGGGVVAAVSLAVGFSYAEVSGNNIRTGNSQIGIDLGASAGAYVYGNNLVGCSVGVQTGDGVNNRIGPNNYIGCTTNVLDDTGYDATYGPVEHFYSCHLHTTSNAAYTDLLDVQLKVAKQCFVEVFFDAQGADEGTVGRRITKIFRLPSSPGAVTVTNCEDTESSAGAKIDVQFKTSTNDHVIIGAKKPSGSSSFQGMMFARIVGMPYKVSQLTT